MKTKRKSQNTARRFSLCLIALALLSACTVRVPEGVETVQDFELERYLGTWYEIGRLDHRFERGLSRVTANYALNDDGTVRVTNRGYRDADGEWEEAEGRAKFVGARDVGELKVSFFGPFYGSYNIMHLDRGVENYRVSLVAGPNKGNLWLLARTPVLDQASKDELVAMARAAGFPVEELIWVSQDS